MSELLIWVTLFFLVATVALSVIGSIIGYTMGFRQGVHRVTVERRLLGR